MPDSLLVIKSDNQIIKTISLDELKNKPDSTIDLKIKGASYDLILSATKRTEGFQSSYTLKATSKNRKKTTCSAETIQERFEKKCSIINLCLNALKGTKNIRVMVKVDSGSKLVNKSYNYFNSFPISLTLDKCQRCNTHIKLDNNMNVVDMGYGNEDSEIVISQNGKDLYRIPLQPGTHEGTINPYNDQTFKIHATVTSNNEPVQIFISK